MITFSPSASLVDAEVHPSCCASVVIPARDEADSLGAAIDRLAEQVDDAGDPVPYERYEVLLLLNNCTDASAAVVGAAHKRYPQLRLHVAERFLPVATAHVGRARRMLMDTAWRRLEGTAALGKAILSTDADTLVARDWVAQNLLAMARGADVVGGQICWYEGEFAQLPAGVRMAYWRDQRYQTLLAELEDAMDPQQVDPLPRHMHHFGASLACTPGAYARAGGLPPLRSLEDVAFVRALRRTGARIRHEPRVKVYTSGRMRGRVEVGLSGQLREWDQMCKTGTPQCVPSAAWWVHRLRLLRALRELVREGRETEALRALPEQWRRRLRQLRGPGRAKDASRELAELLAFLPFERLVEESFDGYGAGEIDVVSRDLARVLEGMPSRARSAEECVPASAFEA